MDGHYEINYIAERKLIHIAIFGFWNMHIVACFEADLAEIVGRADPLSDHMVNTCRAEVQTPQISQALVQLSQSEKHRPGGRLALVSNSALLKMQHKRAFIEDNVGHFETEADALDWLSQL